MGKYSNNLHSYAESLYTASNFSDAFEILENSVEQLGFGGVLYTYIPSTFIDSSFRPQPVYEVSRNYCPEYLSHYSEARFDRHDPLIKAVSDGASDPIPWWGDVCQGYMTDNDASQEVIETSRDYGIKNGVTIPLMSGLGGISGASFISDEGHRFQHLLDDHLAELKVYTNMFHTLVQTNSCYLGRFIKPWLASLNATEMAFLSGLKDGKTPAQIAIELNRSERYLEQVMLRIRRKMSGVGHDEQPLINRNQVMYYFGLLHILENPTSRIQ